MNNEVKLITQLYLNILNESSKDVPLTYKIWKEKLKNNLNWSIKVLDSAIEGDIKTDILMFIKLYNEFRDHDRHIFNNIDFEYLWSNDSILSDLKDLKYSIISIFNTQSDSFYKTQSSITFYEEHYKKRIEFYMQSYQLMKKEMIESTKNNEELFKYDEDVMNTTRKLSIFMNDLVNIIKMIDKFKEVLQTYIEWNKQPSPDISNVKKVYHTSINAKDILENGFQINKKIKGLGGATDNMISTTLSKKVAIEIYNSLNKMIDLANGKLKIKDIKKMAIKHNIWNDIKSAIYELNIIDNPDIKKLNIKDEDEYIDLIDKGYVATSERFKIQLIKDEKLNDDLKLTIFKYYLGFLEDTGKGYNPLFFGVELKNYKGIDKDNIGILELTIDNTDKRIKYYNGMYEYRIPIEAIQHIEEVT